MTRYFAQLAGQVPITGEGLHWSDLDVAPVPRIYLKQSDIGDPVAELRFAYGDQGIVLGPNSGRHETEVVHVAKDQDFVRVKRQIAVEDAAELAITKNGLRKDHRSGEYTLRANTNVLSFLMHQVPHLIAAGIEVFGEESLSGAKINRSAPRLSMHVSSGIDWFDVQVAVTFGDATAAIKAMRQAIKKREKYVKLSDGSVGALPEEWIKKYSYLFSLDGEWHDGGEELRLQKHHAILLSDLLADADEGDADAQFGDMVTRLRSFKSITEHAVPAVLESVLRPYQKHGFDWLHFLREYGAGGCIADDMGLGKTVQVLAFLQSLREADTKARRVSLIVVPRSLIFNWQREAARFSP
jgi:non-specific serine/threonine protein kinase